MSLVPRHDATGRVAVVTLLAERYDRDVDTELLVTRITEGAPLADACGAAGLQTIALRAPLRELFTGDLHPAILCSDDGGVVAVADGFMGPPWRRQLRLLTPEGVIGVDIAALQQFADEAGAVELLVVEGPGLAGANADAHATPARRLWSLIQLERRDILVVLAFGALGSVLTLATPLAVQTLISSIAQSALLQPLVVVSVLLGAALTFGAVMRLMQFFVVEILQRRIFVRLVGDLAWRLPRVAVAERDKQDTTKLVNRFFDVITAQKAMATLLLDGVMLGVEVLIGLALLAAYNPLLLGASLALLAGVVVVIFVLGVGAVDTSVDESYAKHDVAGWLEELVRHPTLFRGASARGFGLQRADVMTRRYITTRRAHFRILMRQAIGSFVLQIIAAVGTLSIGGWLVMDGTLTLGQLAAAEVIVTMITWGLIKLHKQLESAYDLLASLDKIGHLVGLDTERDGGVDVADGALSVTASDVAFDDDDGTFSLHVAAGDVVAVFDHDGRRGTAFAEALFGLNTPHKGRLRIGTDDVRALSLASLRERVQLVRQPELFEGSVADNLRVGHDVDGRDLTAALAIVELDDFFVEGLEQRIVPGSHFITEGVGRRLMIARALVADTGLVVLDGAVDGLPADLVARIVRRLSGTDITVVIVTSDESLAGCAPRTIALAPSTAPVKPPPPTTPHTTKRAQRKKR